MRIWLAWMTVFFLCSLATANAQADRPPNFVVIFADDKY
jgi:hypothetical protein